MFKFLKKWFASVDSPSISNNKAFEQNNIPNVDVDQSYVIDDSIDQNNDNYEYGFTHKQFSDFEILTLRLRNYSGYIRQSTLEQIRDNYDEDLFPHLLDRLSDYVKSNRKLAVNHLERWREHPEFSKLCIRFFFRDFDFTAATSYRSRSSRYVVVRSC
jgi:hypothetical protein